MTADRAECGPLGAHLATLGDALDCYLRFEQADAMQDPGRWRQALNRPLPDAGVGIAEVLTELGQAVIPNGSQIPKPGCTSFITTGATTVGALATLASAVAAPQRIGMTAFNHLRRCSCSLASRSVHLLLCRRGLRRAGARSRSRSTRQGLNQRTIAAVRIVIRQDNWT